MKYKKLFEEVTDKMADSLIEEALLEEKSLEDLSIDNFNSFLDDLFEDGGEVRCEKFGDLAWEYSLKFGALESTGLPLISRRTALVTNSFLNLLERMSRILATSTDVKYKSSPSSPGSQNAALSVSISMMYFILTPTNNS